MVPASRIAGSSHDAYLPKFDIQGRSRRRPPRRQGGPGRLATFSNRSTRGRYLQHSFSLSNYPGSTVIIKFIGKETLTRHNTAFLVDGTLGTVH